MGQPLGTNALPTARGILDRALESPRGIKVNCSTPKRAFSLRMQCYTCKSRERARSTKIYPTDSPMYGCTPWDGLQFQLDGAFLIVSTIASPLDVEEL
jgi:hypothetical protein